MIVKTLDGTEQEWKIPDKIAKGSRRKTSKLHQVAKMMLRNKYPNLVIYEEVPVPISKSTTLYLDLYTPTLNLAVEVHGKQHYEYSGLFHKSRIDFFRGKTNDLKKSTWCKNNDIDLVILKYNEIDKWEQQL